MNDFSLQRKHKLILAVTALAATLVGLYMDPKGFIVNSLSAVLGFTAALMLAGPIMRSFKRQTQLAAALYVVEMQTWILDPTVHRSEQRMGEVESFLEKWTSPTDETLTWLDDLELLARVKYLEGKVSGWHLLNRVSNRKKGAFGTADIDNLPESVAGPFRILLGFFPEELAGIESEFPGVFEWVERYEQSPAAAVRRLGFRQDEWPEQFRQASTKVNIAWEAADSLLHATNGYLRGLGSVITDRDRRLSM